LVIKLPYISGTLTETNVGQLSSPSQAITSNDYASQFGCDLKRNERQAMHQLGEVIENSISHLTPVVHEIAVMYEIVDSKTI
jgi:hypothetical protein